MHTSFVTGLETWFTLPGQPGEAPPPRYKMALVTWITIFPLITAIVAITGPLIKELPLALRLAITTGLTVPLMTWVVMPRVTRLLAAGTPGYDQARTVWNAMVDRLPRAVVRERRRCGRRDPLAGPCGSRPRSLTAGPGP